MFIPKDYYFKKAKKEGYVARSIYKLKEIDEKHKIFHHGSKVLDMGCTPGSWSQYAVEKIGPTGMVFGLDINPATFSHPNFKSYVHDIFEDLPEEIRNLKFDVVLSDMAPLTTGVKLLDKQRSLELSQRAVQLAQQHLTKNGKLVFKTLEGGDYSSLIKECRLLFNNVHLLKPQGTRTCSSEIFLIGKGLK